MSTVLNNLLYPFDPTGRLLSNKIIDEQQIITAANFRDYHFIVPNAAPFFKEGLVLRYRSPTAVERDLVEGVDYYLTHQFISASRACAAPIYGSISFLNTSFAGVIKMDYQTIGGIWTLDEQQIAELLADNLRNPRITSWDEVVDMPVSFPPIDHEWDLQDLVGATEIVDAIQSIEIALRQTGDTGIADHVANRDNPHQTNKIHVGLGSVQNLPLATIPEANAGLINTAYMTPSLTMASINTNAIGPLTLHRNDTENPHHTTAAHVGAYSISQMNVLLAGKLNSGAAAFDTVRFDGRTATEYRDFVLAETGSNTLRFNGFTFLEAKTEFLNGTAANAVLFDGFTLQQVKDQLLAGGIGNASLFNGLTYAEAKADILSGEISNATRLAGLTLPQVKAEVLTGTAANSERFDGYSFNEAYEYFRNEFGGWQSISAEQAVFDGISVSTGQPNRWVHVSNMLDLTDVAAVAKLNNPAWLVVGGNPTTVGNPESDNQAPVYMVRAALVKKSGASWTIDPTLSVTCMSETDNNVQFGVRKVGDTVELWAQVANTFRDFTVTALTKGVDVMENIDTVAAVVDVLPVGLVVVANSKFARVDEVTSLQTYVDGAVAGVNSAITTLRSDMEAADLINAGLVTTLRGEVETSIAALTQAFEDLRAEVSPPPP